MGADPETDTATGGFCAHVDNVDYGALDVLVGYAVRRAQLAIVEAFDREFAAEGITTQRFSALVLVARNPGLTQARLAQVMGISAPQATVVVDALVKLGFVERRVLEDDRRARAVYPTPLGEQRLPQLEAQVLAHDRAVSASLSAAERRSLLRLLARIAS